MILEGNERGYGAELARHLLNPKDNDHVTIHAVDGFVADDLFGAFAEAEAISQATQCQKYLFSLSLNPPIGPTVPVEAFEAAIADVERKLGLTGQPRAVVFHEKNGRRHAHCVWSKIDGTRLRAINLSHYKRKLGDISRDLYRTHEWEMPEGFRDAAKRDPTNYTRPEAGQAKREKQDPKALKAMFRHCWEVSDSKASFAAALQENGFLLARGDRRGFVAVDANGKIWSLSRWCGAKPRELRARLGPEADLPSVEAVLDPARHLPPACKQATDPTHDRRRAELIGRQQAERSDLLKAQETRRIAELTAQQSSIPTGLRAAFLHVTGRFQDVVRKAEAAAARARERDRAEQQRLIDKHLRERRALMRELRRDGLAHGFQSAVARDPRQFLRAPTDDLPLTTAQLLRQPDLILAEISKTEERFDRTDILRALARRIDDPFALRDAADRVLKSPELVSVGPASSRRFTTRDYLAAEERLAGCSARLHGRPGFGVSRQHSVAAILSQNARMQRAFGGRLSDEQTVALDHILGDRQLAAVVGLAGAGKSTLLATAMEAWTRQGLTVHGAALAGKAADGLESASGIKSRTLASLEASWESGYEPISRGDVLVVDEAGMIGTRQLARIAQKIEEIGAKLVLVGDPDQLQPIEAGRPFRDLVETHGATRLSDIHRQREDWQKQASRDLAAGEIETAVAAYAERGAVTRERQRDAAIEALVETYAMDVAANGVDVSRLAFAYRRKDVHELNQAMRGALRVGDDPPPDVMIETETGPRAFADGDRIVFGRNDRALGLRNGQLGTVERISEARIVVTLDGDDNRSVSFDPRRYRHFDHGYAVTIHKSQGATVDRAYVLASRRMDRHLSYVAMTRHRDALQVFVSDDDAPYWAQSRRRALPEREGPDRSGPSMG